MKKTLSLAILWLLAVISVSARQTVSFKGRVLNTQSQPVPGATVYVLNTGLAAYTNEEGFFSIPAIRTGRYDVQVSAVGYATSSSGIGVSGTSGVINFTLTPAAHQLDAVLVTAQKKEEWLQQAPLSISALNAGKVQDYRLWNSRDLTAIIPNLYSANPGDNRNVTSIRGITSTSYDPAVATYIDGVNQFGLDTYIAQLFDVERIEVLRGPQGTLYGRNAMGGVINIITRQPSNRTAGYAELNIGNYGQQRYSLGFRTPLIKDKLYLGVAGVYDRRNGFYTNEFTNTDFDRQHSSTGNYYLKYLAHKNWNITLNVKHQLNRNNGTFPLAYSGEALQNPFRLNQNAVTKMMDNTLNSSLSVQHTGRAFNFSSQTAFQLNHRYYTDPIDGDFSPIDGVTIINNYGNDWNKVSVWTQEFKFTAPAVASKINWTTGAYFFLQNNPVKQATRFGEDAELIGSPDKNFSIINTTEGKSSGLAFYGQLTYPLASKLSVTAGLRYDYEYKKQQVLSEYQQDPNPDPVFDLVPDTSANAQFSAFSPKVILDYQLAAQQNLYASYSRGYRAGGLTQVSSDPSQPPLYTYKPEYSNNLELGFKNTLFNNRLRANLAFFYTTVTDAQVPTLVLPDAITVTRNAGKLSSKGIELELAATPVKGLEADYAFGYTDAAYKTLKLSQNGSEADLAGNKQVFTPDVTSMLALQYHYNLSAKNNCRIVVRGEWQYIGEQYFDLANTIRQSPYHLLNTRLGFASRHVDVMFWMRNVTDEKYIAYAYDFGAVHLGNPKTYGVTVTGRL